LKREREKVRQRERDRQRDVESPAAVISPSALSPSLSPAAGEREREEEEVFQAPPRVKPSPRSDDGKTLSPALFDPCSPGPNPLAPSTPSRVSSQNALLALTLEGSQKAMVLGAEKETERDREGVIYPNGLNQAKLSPRDRERERGSKDSGDNVSTTTRAVHIDVPVIDLHDQFVLGEREIEREDVLGLPYVAEDKQEETDAPVEEDGLQSKEREFTPRGDDFEAEVGIEERTQELKPAHKYDAESVGAFKERLLSTRTFSSPSVSQTMAAAAKGTPVYHDHEASEKDEFAVARTPSADAQGKDGERDEEYHRLLTHHRSAKKERRREDEEEFDVIGHQDETDRLAYHHDRERKGERGDKGEREGEGEGDDDSVGSHKRPVQDWDVLEEGVRGRGRESKRPQDSMEAKGSGTVVRTNRSRK
jgi:hypothetical protein